MVTRAGGFRAKTRFALQKRPRDRGKISITRFMQEFKIGDKVIIAQEPAVHKAMPHPRYKARTGIIIGNQGRSYKVQIIDGKKKKILLAAPIHLNKVK